LVEQPSSRSVYFVRELARGKRHLKTASQITIEKVETDVAIDDSVFKMPKPAEKPKTDDKKPPAQE